MKKNYNEPKVEIIELRRENVITESTGFGGDPNQGGNNTDPYNLLDGDLVK